MAPESKLAVILHADIAGSTAYVHTDERIAHQRFQEAFERLSTVIGKHAGRTLELRGDALVAEFARASDAVVAAVEFQSMNQKVIGQLEDEIRPLVRLGIALGEVVVADNTITGSGVVLAQRLEQLAPPGGVCISAATREAVPGRIKLAYEDRGEQRLKGFDQPQRAYLVANDPNQAEQDKGVTGKKMPRQGAHRSSIAVLPFDNMSSDSEQEFFADGMAEDIITALSMFKELLVIARNSTFTFKGQSVDVSEVAKQLNVAYVVEGSVRAAGAKIRVTAQLIEAESGSHLWAQRYDGQLEDVFDLQDQITEAIVTAVAPMIRHAEIERARRTPPENIDAWAQVQLALPHVWIPRLDAISVAQKHLRTAIEIDPQFATAYAWLAKSLDGEAMLYRSEGAALFTEAASLARKAISIEPDNAVGYAVLAKVLGSLGEVQEAIRAGKRAVTLNPNFAYAHYILGWVNYYGRGDPEEAIKHLVVAARLSPLDSTRATAHIFMGACNRALGNYDAAIEHGIESCELANDVYVAYMHLASSYALAGRQKEAETAALKSMTMFPQLSIEFLRDAWSEMHPNVSGPLYEGLELAGLPLAAE
jgi:adenylate cyclase